MKEQRRRRVSISTCEQSSCQGYWLVRSTLVVLRPASARPLRTRQSDGRKWTVKWLKDDMTPLHNSNYVISSVHMAKNHRKSIPAQSSWHLVHHFISTSFSIGGTKRGSFKQLHPVTTCSCLSPLPNHVWQFVTQGRTKFLIQNCPFRLLLNFLSPNSHVSAYLSLPNSTLN